MVSVLFLVVYVLTFGGIPSNLPPKILDLLDDTGLYKTINNKRALISQGPLYFTGLVRTYNWCGGMESNHHGVAPASPSSWCVYQFRHHRKQCTQPTVYAFYV